MSSLYLVKQSSYTSAKTGKSGILTLLCDEKGNSITSTNLGIIDPKKFPVLPEVTVTIEAGSVFNGRVSSKITGIQFVGEPK